jgi:hypothetical protein
VRAIDPSMRTTTMFEIVNAPRNWMRAIATVGGAPPTSPHGAVNHA